MNGVLVFSLLVAQSPLHLGVSVGTGVDHAMLGAQVELGAGPISVGAAIAPAGSFETAPRAVTARAHLPSGFYLFGSAGTRTYQPVPLNYQVESSFADRWHTFSAGVGLRLGLGGGFFSEAAIGFPVTCGRYWPWPNRADWSWRCASGTPVPGESAFSYPDYSFSIGYALGGERLAGDAESLPPVVMAGWAGAALDGVALGAFTAMGMTPRAFPPPLLP